MKTAYSYTKEDNRVVIISTEVKTAEEKVNIEELEAKIAALEVSKTNTLVYYNDNIARLNAEIAVIKGHIAEANKLGILKSVTEVKFVEIKDEIL